jgi:DNA-binding MarR family transcriptional regulator
MANRYVTRQMSAEGVSFDQWRVLKALSDDPGLTMSRLAEALGLNLPTVTKLVDRMVGEALLYRVLDPDDRRKVRMFVSDKGKALLSKLNAHVLAQERKLESSYSDADLQRLKTLLEDLFQSRTGD